MSTCCCASLPSRPMRTSRSPFVLPQYRLSMNLYITAPQRRKHDRNWLNGQILNHYAVIRELPEIGNEFVNLSTFLHSIFPLASELPGHFPRKTQHWILGEVVVTYQRPLASATGQVKGGLHRSPIHSIVFINAWLLFITIFIRQ
jgi:hypothetical protein